MREPSESSNVPEVCSRGYAPVLPPRSCSASQPSSSLPIAARLPSVIVPCMRGPAGINSDMSWSLPVQRSSSILRLGGRRVGRGARAPNLVACSRPWVSPWKRRPRHSSPAEHCPQSTWPAPILAFTSAAELPQRLCGVGPRVPPPPPAPPDESLQLTK